MKLTGKSNKKGFLNSFLIGMVSGVVIGPCTAPALGVLLGYVAVKTNVLLGMGLLFVFAFGMGTLLIIIGTFAGVIAALPKSGAWMTKIKFISGLILIGAAEYFLYIAGIYQYRKEVMMNKKVLLILVFMFIFVSVAMAFGQYRPGFSSKQEKITAPDFSLKDIQGKTFRLSSQRGNPVIMFFGTTWCPACRSEMPRYQRSL